MLRTLLGGIVILAGTSSAFAAQDGNSDAAKWKRKNTVAAVSALANQSPIAPGPADSARRRSALTSVRVLAGQNKDDDQDGRAGMTRPRDARPVPNEAGEAKPVEKIRKRPVFNAPARPPGGAVPVIDQFGFPIEEPSPFVGPDGFGFSSVSGFRSFGFGYRSSYYWPTYYGPGYFYDPFFFPTPVFATISGPVTTRYDDPFGRQRKQVEDAINKNAQHPPGLIGLPR